MKKRKGFTLLEVLVVSIIIAILAGISIPSYVKWVEMARAKEALENLRFIRDAMSAHNMKDPLRNYQGGCPVVPAEMGIHIPFNHTVSLTANSGVYATKFFQYNFNVACNVVISRMGNPRGAVATPDNTMYSLFAASELFCEQNNYYNVFCGTEFSEVGCEDGTKSFCASLGLGGDPEVETL